MRTINIREALLDLDRKTSGTYELTSLYEACRLDEKEKEELVKYIASYEHPSNLCGYLSSKCEGLNEACGDDEVTEAEMKKIIDDINCGEDHTLWDLMDKADEEDKKLTEAADETEEGSDPISVLRHVWKKICNSEKLTDDRSSYWDFDRCIHEGDNAVLLFDSAKLPRAAKYSFSLTDEGIDIDIYLDRTDIDGDKWYVVDNIVEEGLLDVNVPINVTANNNKVPFLGSTINEEVIPYDKDVEFNDKYFPRVDINDKARYDTVEHKDKFFAYDKNHNILIYLFKDDEEISKFGFDKAPWRELDSAGLSSDSWNDEQVRQDYLDEYCFNLDDEASYMAQDFIQNELPYYQKQGLVEGKDIDSILDTLGGADNVKARIEETRRAYPGIEDDELIDMLWNDGSREDWKAAVEYLSEAVAVAERPLSSLGGTLSSVLLSHKDEVDTLYDKGAAFEFLDRITPEVKNKGYIATVKQNLLKSRGTPVEYFYNIILKGDGDGSIGNNSTKGKIVKWARESLTEAAPSQAILDDCLQDYKENAFGFDGVEDYVETQFPMHADDFKKAVIDYLKGKNESVEEGLQPADEWYLKVQPEDTEGAAELKGLFIDDVIKDKGNLDKYGFSDRLKGILDNEFKRYSPVVPSTYDPMDESAEDDEKPYTYQQVFDELKLETKNFTVEEDCGKYGYESEANHAVKILEKHYASVELDKVGSWFQVDFKDRLKKDKKVTESSESTKLCFTATSDFDREDMTTTLCDALGEMGVVYDTARKLAGKYHVNIHGGEDAVKRAKVAIENCGFFKAWIDTNEGWNPDLVDCPECGDVSFDSKSGKCTKCSYIESIKEAAYEFKCLKCGEDTADELEKDSYGHKTIRCASCGYSSQNEDEWELLDESKSIKKN